MYYIVYKVANRLSGKEYIGTHKTSDLNDRYMGSGKYLKYAQAKYGMHNFTKEILFVFDSPEPMYQKEAELVNEDYLATANTYNLKKGGYGGFDYVNSTGKNLYGQNRENFLKYAQRKGPPAHHQLLKNDLEYAQHYKEKVSMGLYRAYQNGHESPFKGKTHNPETKSKISEASKRHQKGPGNSQYGTMWITNGVENKKIKKDQAIPEGWQKGRRHLS